MKVLKILLVAVGMFSALGATAQDKLGASPNLQVVTNAPGAQVRLKCSLADLFMDANGSIEASVHFCNRQYAGHKNANFYIVDAIDGTPITKFALDWLEVFSATEDVMAYAADMVFDEAFDDDIDMVNWDEVDANGDLLYP